MAKYASDRVQLIYDRSALIITMRGVLKGINTVAQLREYDAKLIKYLPPEEKVVKPLMVPSHKLDSLITCCKSGTKPCVKS